MVVVPVIVKSPLSSTLNIVVEEVSTNSSKLPDPQIESLEYGVVVPIPTYPPSVIVKTSIKPSKILIISPLPDWVTVKAVVAELVAISTTLRKSHSPVISSSSAKAANSSSLLPSNLSALNAWATAVISFLGCITSLLNVTCKYKIWLKFSELKSLTEPKSISTTPPSARGLLLIPSVAAHAVVVATVT